MRTRTFTILTVFILALFAVPQMDALSSGPGSVADEGCSCHELAASSSQTTITVDGLPETFNASETYTFTLTLENDMAIDGTKDHLGGYRILNTGGTIVSADPTLGQELEGGYAHTVAGNKQRSWTFEWTAPADDESSVDFAVLTIFTFDENLLI